MAHNVRGVSNEEAQIKITQLGETVRRNEVELRDCKQVRPIGDPSLGIILWV